MERTEKYAQAALSSACSAISTALAGQRNHTLNTESFGIGQIVGAGMLGLQEAKSALMEAAKQNGMDRHEAEATIKSGIDSGMRTPRDMPDGDAPQRPAPAQKRSTSDYARDLYKAAKPARDTLVEHYLQQHRDIPAAAPSSFRFHPAIWHKGAGQTLPAMVAPIVRTDAEGTRIGAVHVTFLDPKTGAKTKADPAKKMYGACKGGAIWLADYGPHMLCAEGIEKGLACQAATGIPAAVGLSSTLLPSIVWPRGTKKVTLCADPNGAGETAIHKLARALAADGIELFCCYPPEPGKDWDETSPAAIVAAIEGAKPWALPATPAARMPTAEDIEGDFERNDAGQVLKNEHNILRALKWSGVALSYDEFGMEYRVAGLDGYGPDFSKDAREDLYLLIQREYRFKPNWDDFTMVVRSAARRNRFHPVRDYLDGLEWDGVERLDEWLIAHAGAADTPFVRAVSRIVLIAAVRRIRKPGCKFDEMLVLESPEGKNKSTAFAVLASEAWFSDDAPLTASAREVIERLRGRWIVECADLSGMTRAEIEDMKAFLSRGEDAASLKYDPETTKRKRSCIFVGTTNRTSYLISDTGNRRFWPVQIENINIDTLRTDRDQLWAEACYWEAKGASIRLDPSLYAEARIEQDARRIVDPWRDSLEAAFGEISGKLTCDDVWKVIDKPSGQRSQHDNSRMGAAMRDLGWERRRVKIGGRISWGYVRGEPPYSSIEFWKEGNGFKAMLKGDDIFD